MLDQDPSVVKINGMPNLSVVCSDFLHEMRIIGLLSSYYEVFHKSDIDVSEALASRLALSRAVFQFLEYEHSAEIAGGIPFLYNAASWSSPQFGGYTRGSDVKLSEITVSYLTCWLASLRRDSELTPRLSKAALSYVSRTRRFDLGFQYLIDIYAHGYVLERSSFLDSYSRLLRLYACSREDSLLEFVADLTPGSISDEDVRLLNEHTDEIVRTNSTDAKKVSANFEWVLDQTYKNIDHAKAASTADEWVLSCCLVYGLVELVQRLTSEFREALQLGLAHSAMLTQLEEIRADLGAFSVVTRTKYSYRPMLYDPLSLPLLRLCYEKIHGNDWLERLTADRLVIPDQLKHLLNLKEGTPRTRPERWIVFSEKCSFPFGLITGVQPIFMRRTLFPVEAVLKQLGTVQFQDVSKQNFDKVVSTLYQDPPGIVLINSEREVVEALSQVHKDLCLQEMQTEMIDATSERFPEKIDRLLYMRREYPWLGFVARELAICNDEAGDHSGAVSVLVAALVLEPNDPISWHSLGVVCLHLGFRVEYDLCLAIEYMISRRN